MAKKDDDGTLSVDDKFELLIAALTAKREDGITRDDLARILQDTAKVSAESMQRAMKPENDSHPAISAFSYPEGDREKTRGTILTHEFYYNGFPVHKFWETHHWRELELAEQVTPGSYTVLRRDGTTMPVEVTGERNASGVLTKVDVKFAVSREERHYIAPMVVVLYQLVHHDNPRKRFVEAMQEHLNTVVAAV